MPRHPGRAPLRGRLLPALLLAAACAGALLAPAGASPPVDPPVFTSPLEITNPFHPFTPGGVKLFTGVDEGEKIAIVDLYLAEMRTFRFGGVDIPTRILQETEFAEGRLVEISRNFFAQADDGTVYYFGEVVDDYEDGVIVGHGGSWLVGGPTDPSDPPETGTAKEPAVFMPGNPERGDVFKPEDVFPIADETVTIVAVNQRVVVPAGRFRGALRVRETSRLSPGSETKWYAPGVGVVKGKARGESFRLIAFVL